MKKPLAYAATIFSVTLLFGCTSSTESGSKLISFPGAYKIDVQQGNAITQEMVDQLRLGMSRSQVQYIMGAPLLEDSFNKDRWDYIDTNQPGGKKRTQKSMTLFFKDDLLKTINGDLKPGKASKP